MPPLRHRQCYRVGLRISDRTPLFEGHAALLVLYGSGRSPTEETLEVDSALSDDALLEPVSSDEEELPSASLVEVRLLSVDERLDAAGCCDEWLDGCELTAALLSGVVLEMADATDAEDSEVTLETAGLLDAKAMLDTVALETAALETGGAMLEVAALLIVAVLDAGVLLTTGLDEDVTALLEMTAVLLLLLWSSCVISWLETWEDAALDGFGRSGAELAAALLGSGRM